MQCEKQRREEIWSGSKVGIGSKKGTATNSALWYGYSGNVLFLRNSTTEDCWRLRDNSFARVSLARPSDSIMKRPEKDFDFLVLAIWSPIAAALFFGVEYLSRHTQSSWIQGGLIIAVAIFGSLLSGWIVRVKSSRVIAAKLSDREVFLYELCKSVEIDGKQIRIFISHTDVDHMRSFRFETLSAVTIHEMLHELRNVSWASKSSLPIQLENSEVKDFVGGALRRSSTASPLGRFGRMADRMAESIFRLPLGEHTCRT
jgi:hypothetical protein